jgi:hypothetical protein
MVVSGNTCSLPGYRGNEGSLAIYDVRGRLLERNMAIQKGMPELKRRGAAMANGVFIVRMKE